MATIDKNLIKIKASGNALSAHSNPHFLHRNTAGKDYNDKERQYHVHVMIVADEDTGLMLFRRNGKSHRTYPNQWCFPVFTHIYHGETPTTAAIRSLKEDLGMEIEEGDLVDVVQADHDNEIEKSFDLLFMLKLPLKRVVNGENVEKLPSITLDFSKIVCLDYYTPEEMLNGHHQKKLVVNSHTRNLCAIFYRHLGLVSSIAEEEAVIDEEEEMMHSPHLELDEIVGGHS